MDNRPLFVHHFENRFITLITNWPGFRPCAGIAGLLFLRQLADLDRSDSRPLASFRVAHT